MCLRLRYALALDPRGKEIEREVLEKGQKHNESKEEGCKKRAFPLPVQAHPLGPTLSARSCRSSCGADAAIDTLVVAASLASWAKVEDLLIDT